jgi:hypothetical protein
MGEGLWDRLVTAEELHDAAELLRGENPAGTPEGITQAQEIGRFIRESDFALRELDGTITEGVDIDVDSLAYGVTVGLLVTRHKRHQSARLSRSNEQGGEPTPTRARPAK